MAQFKDLKYVESMWNDEVGSGFSQSVNEDISMVNNSIEVFADGMRKVKSYLNQDIEYKSKWDIIQSLKYEEEK